MAPALKDDRCASTASMGENVAIAMNVRHDLNVLQGFTLSSGAPVYVDPFGFQANLKVVGSSSILRIQPSFAANAFLSARWFSLPDDITFNQSGTPDTISTGGTVDRGRRYTYAYLLSRPQPLQDDLVNLTIVVYSGRPVGALTAEPTYAAPGNPVTGAAGTNAVTIKNILASQLSLKIGGWIMDTSGNLYRVTNISDDGATATVLEVTPNLKAEVSAVIVMDYVAEVFDKGTSWQP